MRKALVLALWLAPATAAAHSVGTDLSVGSMGLGPKDRATFLAFNFNGLVEVVRDRLNVDLGYGLLKDEGSAVRHLGLAGLEVTPSDHWNFGLMGSASPRRSATYPLSDRLTGVVEDWNAGLTLMGGYDTFGDSDLETAVDASVGLTRYRSVQKAQTDAGRLTIASTLDQLRLGLGVTETLFRDTDLSLRLGWWAYGRPPTEAADQLLARLGMTVGAGTPLAPMLWEVRPMVLHRFTRSFSARLQLGVGRYVGGGSTGLAQARATFRPTRRLRLFASLALQRDVEVPGEAPLLSRYLGLGTEVRFD